MHQCTLFIIFVLAVPMCESLWRSSSEEDVRKPARKVVYHDNKQMTPKRPPANAIKATGPASKRRRLKTPLTMRENDFDYGEVRSVTIAIRPPTKQPIFKKTKSRRSQKRQNTTSCEISSYKGTVSNDTLYIIKDVLTTIGREFLTHQLNEEFVFGQYIGIALKNISSQYKLNFQHDILGLVIKYQTLSRDNQNRDDRDTIKIMSAITEDPNDTRTIRSNETDDLPFVPPL